MTATKKFSTLLGVSALALALVGCSSNGDNTDSPEPGTQPPADSGELTTINVGTLPVVETAVLMLGEEQGFFAERGIELDYTLAQSGSAIVAGIASKQYDVGFSATLSVYAAAQRGLPLVMLTAASASNEEPDKGTNDIIVRPDGSITSILDLEGKRVGVNAVESISDVLAKNGMEAEGGDPDSIEFVEIGFGDMIPQLESGNIDAFVAGEPFGTMAKDAGMESLINLHQSLVPGGSFVFGAWFVNQEAADADPDLYVGLREAIDEANAYATENPEDLRAMVPEVTTMDPDILERIILNRFQAELTTESLRPLAAAAVKYGVLDDEPDYEGLIWQP